jgi:hypothetical protein
VEGLDEEGDRSGTHDVRRAGARPTVSTKKARDISCERIMAAG